MIKKQASPALVTAGCDNFPHSNSGTSAIGESRTAPNIEKAYRRKGGI